MSKTYRFSLGDSDKGALGLCFDVVESDEAQAVATARDVLERHNGGFPLDFDGAYGVMLYLNSEAKEITADAIVNVSDMDS